MPIFRGIARALDAAHAKGILHRDLKPENVFLVVHEDKSVEPKLLDFGLVKLLDAKAKDESGNSHNTKTGTPMGTPYYMSPEQCRGLDVDARTDVYSFGAMVFEVLTGDVPYQGQSTMDILMQHMTKPPPSASERCKTVPVMLDTVIAQIMAKEPAQRPGTVGAAVELLAQAGGLSLESSPQLRLDSMQMTASERAVAPTVMATPAPTPAPTSAQTFLGGAETQIAEEPVKRRRLFPLVAVGSVLVGAIVYVASTLHAPAPATPLVQSPAPSASELPRAAAPTDVELRIDGIPAETVVTANGNPLGIGSGPFHIKKNASLNLSFNAPGYKPKDVTIMPDANMLLSVTLEKQGAAAQSAQAPTQAPTHHPSPAASKKVHSDLENF
jgi:serine/threonine-protein kinase